MAFAETTKVPVSQTRSEIEALLKKAGGSRVVTMDEPTEATVMCMLGGRLLRFRVPLSEKTDDQTRRARWRALLLVIKAKREFVESGIETMEEAWLAHVVLPDGQTMAQWAEPTLKLAYETGRMPSDPLRLSAPAGDGGRDA